MVGACKRRETNCDTKKGLGEPASFTHGSIDPVSGFQTTKCHIHERLVTVKRRGQPNVPRESAETATAMPAGKQAWVCAPYEEGRAVLPNSISRRLGFALAYRLVVVQCFSEDGALEAVPGQPEQADGLRRGTNEGTAPSRTETREKTEQEMKAQETEKQNTTRRRRGTSRAQEKEKTGDRSMERSAKTGFSDDAHSSSSSSTPETCGVCFLPAASYCHLKGENHTPTHPHIHAHQRTHAHLETELAEEPHEALEHPGNLFPRSPPHHLHQGHAENLIDCLFRRFAADATQKNSRYARVRPISDKETRVRSAFKAQHPRNMMQCNPRPARQVSTHPSRIFHVLSMCLLLSSCAPRPSSVHQRGRDCGTNCGTARHACFLSLHDKHLFFPGLDSFRSSTLSPSRQGSAAPFDAAPPPRRRGLP